MRGKGTKKLNLSTQAVPNILSLPDVPFFTILGFCSYDQVANLRRVCKKFDEMCGKHLNHGYQLACAKHNQLTKEFESMLPKRYLLMTEHHLYDHRQVLYYMNFTVIGLKDYMDKKICCFYPGKIIDEMFNIFRIVSAKKPFPSFWSSIIEELDDLDTLAQSHFNQYMEPMMQKKLPKVSYVLNAVKVDQCNDKKYGKLEKKINSIENVCKRQSKALSAAKKRAEKQAKKLTAQSKELKDLQSKYKKLEMLLSKMTPDVQCSPAKKRKQDDQDAFSNGRKRGRRT